jgi:hypothetical protein
MSTYNVHEQLLGLSKDRYLRELETAGDSMAHRGAKGTEAYCKGRIYARYKLPNRRNSMRINYMTKLQKSKLKLMDAIITID